MLLIFFILFVSFFLLNWRVRKTVAYKNFYRTIHVVKDVPKQKKYQIAAFGSTFGYYAFDLKEFGGHNFSIEPQSMIYMRKTVDHFVDNIEEGGYALLSLAGCFFATESTATDEECITYYSFLKPEEFNNYRKIVKIKYILKRYLPVLSPYYLKCIFQDEKPKYSSQTGLSKENGQELAKRRVKGWERVVGQNITEGYKASDEIVAVMQRNVERMKEMIRELHEKNIQPVFIVLPMSESFNEVCPEAFYSGILYKCLSQFNNEEVITLDYLHDEEISKIENYLTADSLNQKGRKLLTDRIINDLRQIDNSKQK